MKTPPLPKRLTEQVFQFLRKKNLTLSIAESCTAGTISSELVKNIPGISLYFKGGVVAYSPKAKSVWLSINEKDLETDLVVSESIAQKMARNIRLKLDTDLGLGITGSAGPLPEKNSAVGVFCLALADRNKTLSKTIDGLKLPRNEFIMAATHQALKMIVEYGTTKHSI